MMEKLTILWNLGVPFIVARLKEPSTWRGISIVLTALGVAVNPEQVQAILVGGLSIAGAIGIFTPDNPKEKK